MDIWLAVGVGAFIGVGVAFLVFMWLIGSWYIGDLREDKSEDEEKPYYFMEVSNGGSAHIRKNRFVLLRVKRENYIQE